MYKTLEQLTKIITENLNDEILSLSFTKVPDEAGVVIYEVRLLIEE